MRVMFEVSGWGESTYHLMGCVSPYMPLNAPNILSGSPSGINCNIGWQPRGFIFCGIVIHDPSHSPFDLFQLMTIPDASQKIVIHVLYIAQSLSSLTSRVESSAYCTILWYLSPTLIPTASDLLIRLARPWTTIANMRGNRLSPCLPPPGKSKNDVSFPLIIKDACVDVKPNFFFLYAHIDFSIDAFLNPRPVWTQYD